MKLTNVKPDRAGCVLTPIPGVRLIRPGQNDCTKRFKTLSADYKEEVRRVNVNTPPEISPKKRAAKERFHFFNLRDGHDLSSMVESGSSNEAFQKFK